ncbi:hypothetical protein LTR94_036758, partial [Friedmanniomyces endolithicus]
PMPRSISATRAGPWSIPKAICWALMRQSIRRLVARSGSASRFPCRPPRPCSIRSSSTAAWCAAGSASNRRTSRPSWPTVLAWPSAVAPSSPA